MSQLPEIVPWTAYALLVIAALMTLVQIPVVVWRWGTRLGWMLPASLVQALLLASAGVGCAAWRFREASLGILMTGGSASIAAVAKGVGEGLVLTLVASIGPVPLLLVALAGTALARGTDQPSRFWLGSLSGAASALAMPVLLVGAWWLTAGTLRRVFTPPPTSEAMLAYAGRLSLATWVLLGAALLAGLVALIVAPLCVALAPARSPAGLALAFWRVVVLLSVLAALVVAILAWRQIAWLVGGGSTGLPPWL